MPRVIDQYSLATVPIQMQFGESKIAVATAFFWAAEGRTYLITNWHNVSGKDPFTGKHRSPTAAEPDRLRVLWNVKEKLGQKLAEDDVMLRDGNGDPRWIVHPMYREKVDVVALSVDPPKYADCHAINQMPSDEDLNVEVGSDVYILGYPYGIGPGGLPVWKRGSIATEPQIFTSDRQYILVDSASRQGMSGSPVIRRTWGAHPLQGGGMALGGATATKFVGVYSGRLASTDPNDPQLGLTWPARFIPEIIAGGILG